MTIYHPIPYLVELFGIPVWKERRYKSNLSEMADTCIYIYVHISKDLWRWIHLQVAEEEEEEEGYIIVGVSLLRGNSSCYASLPFTLF